MNCIIIITTIIVVVVVVVVVVVIAEFVGVGNGGVSLCDRSLNLRA
jgi:hypothetical protein